MSGPKLTFITDEASPSPAAFIKLARAHEIDAVELRNVDGIYVGDFPAERLKMLSTRLSDSGIGVCCLASPVFKCAFATDLTAEFDRLRRSLDAAGELGAPLVRLFSFWLQDDAFEVMPGVVDALAEAARVAEGYSCALAVENGRRTMHRTGGELARLLAALSGTGIGAVWDPGNCIFGLSDTDPITNGYPVIAPWVRHVHVKDPELYDGGKAAYVEIGRGQLDIARQMAVLRRDGFTGYASLETHWRPRRTFTPSELDSPGRRAFSRGGYAATSRGLATLAAAGGSAQADAVK